MKLRSKRSLNVREKENLPHQKVSPAQQIVQSHQTLTNHEAFDQVYKDLSQPGSFTAKIKKYLYSNVTHSLHKPRRKKFKRRRIITHYPYQIVQMDLRIYNRYLEVIQIINMYYFASTAFPKKFG